MDKKNNSSFVIGVLIGAAITYLFTTENGRRIKAELTKESAKLLDKIGDTLEDIEEEHPQIKNAENKLISAKEGIQDAIEDIRDITHEALGEQDQKGQNPKKSHHFFFKKTPARGES